MRRLQWLYSLSMATSIALMLIPTHRALAQPADVSVEVIDGPRRARAGQQVVYTVEVTNNGPSVARVTLMARTTPQLQITDSSCGSTSGPAFCDFGPIFPGRPEIASFEARVRLPRGSSRLATFTAEVMHGQPDPDPQNNTASTTTRIVGPPQ